MRCIHCVRASDWLAGEVMLGHLQQSGFQIIDNHEDADAIIVNTCAFIEDAKSSSLDVILQAAELRAQKENKRLVVTGCMAQRYAAELSEELPEIDAIVGFESYQDLPATLHEVMCTPTAEETDGAQTHTPPSTRVRVGQATVPFRPEAQRVRLSPPHSAYLRVAEGCNHACSFCAIPGFRGKFRSKPFDAILHEAETLVSSGVKELNLIAEDTNQYGMDRYILIAHRDMQRSPSLFFASFHSLISFASWCHETHSSLQSVL
jgi:ribosomal protein S12 methylthiotransferase